MSEYKHYENGVADVLAFLARDVATVRRNARLPSRSGKRARQIDVLVQGRIFGLTDATMVVDCKCWARTIDVKDVESFIGMLADVCADIGMIMTTRGVTDGARRRARQERGVRLEVMSLSDLTAWCPPGTVNTTYRIPNSRVVDAEKALRTAGYRVYPDIGYPSTDDTVVLRVIRHYGTDRPPGDLQHGQIQQSQAALRRIGIEPVHVANAVTISGGTPAHRWLEVTANGVDTGFKVVAATESEAETKLDRIAHLFAQAGVTRQMLSVVKPEGWPVSQLFGL